MEKDTKQQTDVMKHAEAEAKKEVEKSFTVTYSKTEPFVLITTKKGVQIALGNRLATTQYFKTKRAAEKYIEKRPWDLIIALTYATAVLSKEGGDQCR